MPLARGVLFLFCTASLFLPSKKRKKTSAPRPSGANRDTARRVPPKKKEHPTAFYWAFRPAPVGPASGAVAAISVHRGGVYKSQNILLACLSAARPPRARAAVRPCRRGRSRAIDEYTTALSRKIILMGFPYSPRCVYLFFNACSARKKKKLSVDSMGSRSQ